MADHDADFKCEYAKSNRASCKSCKQKIDKDVLRLARLIPSPHFDGKQPLWYHFDCFFPKFAKGVRTEADISGFDGLRWDDAQRIKAAISGEAPASNDKGAPKKPSASSAPASAPTGQSRHTVEYAKSSRATCRSMACGQTIMKGEVRISKVMKSDDPGSRFQGFYDAWFHPKCFMESWDGGALTTFMLKGFTELSADDQSTVKQLMASHVPAIKSEPAAPVDAKEASRAALAAKKLERDLKAQSDIVWKTHDDIKKYLTTKDIKALLEANGQNSSGGDNTLRERLADRMTFGALKLCPECPAGELELRAYGYHCTGHLTEWTSCNYSTTAPERRPFKIPKSMKEDNAYLAQFDFVPRVRKFQAAPAAPRQAVPSSATLAQAREAALNKDAESAGEKPLRGMRFMLIGRLAKSAAQLKEEIESLGGSVTKSASSADAFITTKAEYDKGSDKVQAVSSLGKPIHTEAYIAAALAEKKRPPRTSHRLNEEGEMKKRTWESGSGGAEKRVKLTVKGRAAVFPESELGDTHHVLERGKDVYSVTLSLTDVARGLNSFYKLQILQEDNAKKCQLFRSWGRIGAQAKHKLETVDSVDEAVERFEELYSEKTGNEWHERHNFIKRPMKFHPVEVDYGEDDENLKKAMGKAVAPGERSALPKPVKDLVQLIFDIEQFKRTLLEFEIDIKKMPLGKLTKRHIQEGYKVLHELGDALESAAGDDSKARKHVLDATNRFYTLIPHDFGRGKPPLIDTLALIAEKSDMLDSLVEMEIAQSLLSASAVGHEDEDPIAVRYKSLKSTIEVVPSSASEFELISKYIRNTHGKTHTAYTLHVEDVFAVQRAGETQRYIQKYKDLENKQLLWHGSRITNYAGIISQGLRIAPPEAPVTGYMFGKGIYTADMVTKSANYCHATPENPYGLLLLCEVALGKPWELTKAKFVERLPAGKNSVKGIGGTKPDPKETVILPDGVAVPCGKGIKHLAETELLYNEFIVYDADQLRIRYLLKVRFDFKKK